MQTAGQRHMVGDPIFLSGGFAYASWLSIRENPSVSDGMFEGVPESWEWSWNGG